MESRVEQLISFLKEIEKSKTIERKVFNSNMRFENDAEHAWHLAMFLILFEKDFSSEVDKLKALKMALIHDLVEIYSGDTFAFDKEAKKTQKEREGIAASKLFSQLPDDLNQEFSSLFKEFEECETKEAKIVNSFDKIQPILQNLCSEGKAWKERKITYQEVDEYKRLNMIHDRNIFDLYERLMSEAREKGLL